MKGKFKPKVPNKYKGDPSNIVYRSSWELRFMMMLDENSNVISWSSEELVIPYRTKIKPRKVRRYYPDFWVKKRTKNNTVDIVVVEIKPAYQCKPPKKQAKPSRKYLTEIETWDTNSSKWEAASEFCKDRGWDFKIITEHDLGLKF
jgi:hypothetical protein